MEQYFVLENGVKLPKIGYGTYKSTDGSGGRIIHMALEAGYRLLDTAAVYENETEVGVLRLYRPYLADVLDDECSNDDGIARP